MTKKLAGSLEELHLPDTVHAVIRARVDRLGPDAREVLRLASVIGREFNQAVLERLYPAAERLADGLQTLARRDIVHQVRVVPEAAYIFKNVLTQVVVYETLLLQQRKELHAKVGQAIEALYPDRLEEHFEALAYHFENGEVWDKAMLYLVRAGIKARQSYSLKTALALFDRAKDILENRAPDVRWKVRYDLYYERSQILGEMAQWLFAYQDICKAEEIARNEGELKLRIRTMFTTAFFAFWAALPEHALAKCSELEPLVADDPANMLGVVVQQAFVLVMLDDIDAALQKEHETRELMARAPDSPHIGKAAYVIGLFSRWRGDYRKTQEMIKPMLPKQKTEAAAGIYLNSVLHYGLSLGECG
ncbi:MAG: hypothetical protein IIC51_04325, partial [Planctomycetes bacterium]|nr:hypothetical protein [Planctomycetota bacterium]